MKRRIALRPCASGVKANMTITLFIPCFMDALFPRAGISMISFITGPSRTGDIERILVLGAHGPKKLTIFCF